MSKKYTERCVTADKHVKLKHYFYEIRTSLAASWIRLYSTMPPIRIEEIIDHVMAKEIAEKTRELVVLKSMKNETYMHFREPLIDQFLVESLEKNEKISGALASGKANLQTIDDVFRKWVM